MRLFFDFDPVPVDPAPRLRLLAAPLAAGGGPRRQGGSRLCCWWCLGCSAPALCCPERRAAAALGKTAVPPAHFFRRSRCAPGAAPAPERHHPSWSRSPAVGSSSQSVYAGRGTAARGPRGSLDAGKYRVRTQLRRLQLRCAPAAASSTATSSPTAFIRSTALSLMCRSPPIRKPARRRSRSWIRMIPRHRAALSLEFHSVAGATVLAVYGYTDMFHSGGVIDSLIKRVPQARSMAGPGLAGSGAGDEATGRADVRLAAAHAGVGFGWL